MRYSIVSGISTPLSRCTLGTSGIRTADKHRLLDVFFEAGGNCIDTARAYGGGAAEVSVGEWIRRNRPDNLVVVVKGAHPPNCEPAAVSIELTQSLEALGIERADLYMLHRDNTDVPVGEFIDALETEVAAGRITAYGGSNWSKPRLAEAQRYAADNGCDGMAAISNHFSLAEPVEPLYPGCESVSPDLAGYLADNDIALFPWSSQARGFFSDAPWDGLDPNVWRCWDSEDNHIRRERAAKLAASLGVRPINIALGYVLGQPFDTFPIIGPQTEEQLRLALDGVDLVLEPAQLTWLATGT